ncbi:hypothetical protein CKAN_01990900 [Cinnamomum micranthum f. kanehirae]|uniref:Uncharacterized protein n=1 Tax=Cinnamomum micranthum f. kanehirae TaxID=337451 RepID=A0A443PJ53_9MAGN|nr:hypothetical protein CKAN_01990900 [Cinnamomum micranthum f. kanehirae]
MAKKRNKKKRDGAISMELSADTNSGGHDFNFLKDFYLFPVIVYAAMDTSEVTVSKPVLGVGNRKIKKAAAMKRSKNLRKMKGIEKAISKSEQSEEKISKCKIKVQRIQSAKSLYD